MTEKSAPQIDGTTGSGDFVGRDKNIHGDEVHGDKFGGDKVLGDKIIYQAADKLPLYVNVPSMPNYFVGRGELIKNMVGQLLSGQQVALSAEGLPGVGKTTMAVALAHHQEVLKHFKDGVLWAGLGPTPDVMSQLARWATALKLDVSELVSEQERSAAVKDAIGERSLLLVIDDAWDLNAATYLRCGGPNCCHILTTRNQTIARLFAGASHVVNTPVLQEEDAYQLLEKMAPEAWAADPETAKALVEAVGRLPLAIELLGGYLAIPERTVFTDLTREALEEMGNPQQRLQLASQRLGAADGQKVSLQETIALSVERLPKAGQEAFYALGAFAPKPDTFDRAAAEAVTNANAATLALLIARNLVEIDANERLALHQTLADVARTDTPTEAMQNHRDFYLAQVNEDRENWQRIELLYNQLKWAWASTLDNHQLDELRESVAVYQKLRGLWNDKADWLERLLQLARAQGERQEEAKILWDLGFVYLDQERWEDALQMLLESLVIYRQLGHSLFEGHILNGLGTVYSSQEKWEEAIQMYQEALAIYRQLDYSHGVTSMLNNLGVFYREQKQWEKAIQLLQDGLVISRRLGDIYFECEILNNLGAVYYRQERWEEAIQMFKDSLVISRRSGESYWEGCNLKSLGEVYYKQGKWEKAIQMFSDSQLIYHQRGDIIGEGSILNKLGLAYESRGEPQKALNIYQEALTKLHPDSSEYRTISERLHNSTK